MICAIATGSCKTIVLLLMTGTTLHAQAGCGIINMWNDFGKMWRKPAIEKWRAIKVLLSWCMPCEDLSNECVCVRERQALKEHQRLMMPQAD